MTSAVMSLRGVHSVRSRQIEYELFLYLVFTKCALFLFQ